MKEHIKQLYQQKPLTIILVTALLVRLLSVFFSKGYGMHDDHFLIIEASKSWVDGYDYNAWLPWTKGNTGPSGHSLFYVGLHFILFKGLNSIGVSNPETLMWIVRFFHALFSLSVIYYAHKLTSKISTVKNANLVGWLLALYWFIPMLSVRNLVELVCLPFLIAATWFAFRAIEQKKILLFIVAGFIAGFAFSIRFQTLFFIGGLGLALLLLKEYKGAFAFGFAAIFNILLVQSIPDYFLWKRPFAEFTEYVTYNMQNATTYFNKPWYMYLVLLSGILIPPVSLFLWFGYFKNWKKQLLLFLPSLLFLAFHSYFPNKQERFIFPVIPFIIILGIVGWMDYVKTSTFWQKRTALHKGLWIFAICINMIVLPVISTAYSKRSRVETMLFLKNQGDLKGLIVENSNHAESILSPRFYLDKWKFPEHAVTQTNTPELLYSYFVRDSSCIKPNYVIFYEEENFDQRLNAFKAYFPNIELIATIEPSFLDDLLHKLNKHNKNSVCYVFKLKM